MMRALRTGPVLVGLVALANFRGVDGGEPLAPSNEKGHAVARGEELFHRKWEIDDPRGKGGDGLGPVFNERSCVACHSLGGAGGGGRNDKNIDILSIKSAAIQTDVDREFLADIHPELKNGGSIVVHKSGTIPGFEGWRRQLRSSEFRASAARFEPAFSQRNSTALFGAGRIDAIEDVVIEREAERQAWHKPEIKGRVPRRKDGRIGRFGWKGQVAGLSDFVLNACAVEIGLETSTRHQAADPFGFASNSRGLDLSDADGKALIDYIGGLPQPIEKDRESHRLGFDTFQKIGCADCHKPDLGSVEGLYSDLLLHDMGVDMAGTGSYASIGNASCRAPVIDTSPIAPGETRPGEWRTPPLWGVASSAPYLHDGRARTLTDAIRSHRGQAAKSAAEFARLPEIKRKQLIGFLRSLEAPGSK